MLPQLLYPQGNFLNIKDTASSPTDYNINVTKDLVENLPGGVVKDVFAPAVAASLSLPYDAIQAYQRMEPGSGLQGYSESLKRERPIASMMERTVGAAGPLAERLSNNNRTLTVNDLIGLNYSNLRNPITPRQDMNSNQPFLNSSYPQPEFFPNDQQGSLNVNMGATGTIPTAANINAQPLIGETSGIAPLLTSDTNMPLDYEEMIKKDSSIVTPPKKKIGLENILQLALSAAIPGAGFLMRAPKGLAGLNRRFRKNLDDFFDRRKYDGRTRDQAYANMITQTRGIQKKIDAGKRGTSDISIDRGRGSIPSRSTTTSSKRDTSPSSSYSQASYDRRKNG